MKYEIVQTEQKLTKNQIAQESLDPPVENGSGFRDSVCVHVFVERGEERGWGRGESGGGDGYK